MPPSPMGHARPALSSDAAPVNNRPDASVHVSRAGMA